MSAKMIKEQSSSPVPAELATASSALPAREPASALATRGPAPGGEPLQQALLKLIAGAGSGRGSLLDLGGALRPLAGQLESLGLSYHAIPADLSMEELEQQLGWAAPIALLCLCDLSAVSDPGALLEFLAHYAARQPLGALLLAAPNLSHQTVVASLLAGASVDRRTLMAGTTNDALAELVARHGWSLAARHDLLAAQSDQHQPALLLHQQTLAGSYLRDLAQTFNPQAQTSDFIWMLRPRLGAVEQPPVEPEQLEPAAPALSILLRTQGRRLEQLTEALYSIYAQSCQPERYELLIGLQSFAPPQSSHDEELERFISFLGQFPGALTSRIRVARLFGDGSVAPINPLLELARGDYLIFWDEQDLMLPGCLETLVQAIQQHGHEAPIIQSLALLRRTAVASWPVLTGTALGQAALADAPNLTVNGLRYSDLFSDPDQLPRSYPYVTRQVELAWKSPYWPVRQHLTNELHPSSYIFPRALVSQTNIRFNSELIVYNHWEYLTRIAEICHVLTIPAITSCVGESSAEHVQEGSGVAGLHDYYFERITSDKTKRPHLFPGKAIPEIVDHVRASSAARRQLEQLSQQHGAYVREVESYVRTLEQAHASVQRGLIWRMTSPLRKLRRRLGF